MKELLQVWGRVAGRTYSAVGRNENSTSPAQSKNKGQKAKKRKWCALVLCLSSLVVGLVLMLVSPYDLIFNWKVTFGEGGEIYEMWRKPAVDLYLRVYLFNVTNSEAFLAGEEPLNVKQVGPYVYRELLEHGNVTFNDNGTLSSTPIHPLQWEPLLSYPQTTEDILMLPNIAMLAIGHVGATSNVFTRLGVNTLLRSTGSQPLVRMSAHEFMFGHRTPLVTLGNSFLPGWIKFDRLGLIDRMYDFDEEFETVFTGEDNSGGPSLSGLLDTWHGARSLPHWEGDCGNIHFASDGTKFPGNLEDGRSVLFYRKSLCRAAPMVKVAAGWADGLWGYEYTFDENALDNGLKNENNKCFCRGGNCLPDGLIDVTDCYYGFPIALSYPHFLNGSRELSHNLQGLTPDDAEHGSSFLLQPRSGLPLRVAARFQINMALHTDLSSVHNLAHFSHMTLPLLWFEIRMFNLPEQMINLFKVYLNVLPEAERVLSWLLLLGAPLPLLWVLRGPLRRLLCPASPTFTTPYNPKRRHSRYATALRKMSLDIEAKLQGVYGPCEIPLDAGESASPFLEAVELTSDSDEKSQDREQDQAQVERATELGRSFGSRMQENFDGIRKNIKNLTDRLSKDSATLDSDDANNNEGFSSESCQSGGEEEGSRSGPYRRVGSSDEEACHVEIMDDGSEFDVPMDAFRRRQSRETARMEQRMNLLETGGTEQAAQEGQRPIVARDALAKLPYLPEEQV